MQAPRLLGQWKEHQTKPSEKYSTEQLQRLSGEPDRRRTNWVPRPASRKNEAKYRDSRTSRISPLFRYSTPPARASHASDDEREPKQESLCAYGSTGPARSSRAYKKNEGGNKKTGKRAQRWQMSQAPEAVSSNQPVTRK